MYFSDHKVSYSQCGEDRRMTPLAIVDAMQDCSCEHSDDVGVGREYLIEHHGGWLLNTWQILLDRIPSEGDFYRVETRAWKFQRFFGHRNFSLTDENGDYYVRANSLWFYVDTDRMRPVLPTKDVLEAYGLDERIEMPYVETRHLKVPENMKERESFPVLRSHIDSNHHVNNAQYVMMACEYLPDDYDIAEIRVEYRTAAKYGDRIYPKVGLDPDGWTVVTLCQEDGSIYVVAAFRCRER